MNTLIANALTAIIALMINTADAIEPAPSAAPTPYDTVSPMVFDRSVECAALRTFSTDADGQEYLYSTTDDTNSNAPIRIKTVPVHPDKFRVDNRVPKLAIMPRDLALESGFWCPEVKRDSKGRTHIDFGGGVPAEWRGSK